MSTQDLKFEEWNKTLEESGVAVYRSGSGTQEDWIITLPVALTWGEEIGQLSVAFPLHARQRLENHLPPEYDAEEIMAAVTEYVQQKYHHRLEYEDGATPQDFVRKYKKYHFIIADDLPDSLE